MNSSDYLHELQKALREFRFEDASKLNNLIVPSSFSEDQAKKTLGLLRKKKQFAEMERIAGMFVAVGLDEPKIRLQYAQALLDLNRIPQGIDVLTQLQKEAGGDPVEGPEILGLLGRAAKQQYVNGGEVDNLIRAVAAYKQGWTDKKGDYRWHGINLVALLNRAHKDAVNVDNSLSADEVASLIRNEIEEKEKKDYWDYGTAMEASIALNDKEGALYWARSYARHPGADAFELNSTIRQLKEVWKLEDTEIGDSLLPVLEYELLQREGGEVKLTSPKVLNDDGFEAVYGGESYINFAWTDLMYKQTMSIGRVYKASNFKKYGTGFLVKGSDLKADWGDQPVFITNAHVISNHPRDGAPIQPGEGAVEFTRLHNKPRVKLGEMLFSSIKNELDISVFRIDPPANAITLDLTTTLPKVSKEENLPTRIYVIGHPMGDDLVVSLYNNSLIKYEKEYVYYRSPTQKGSSGSPVFNSGWELFALHHRAKKCIEANEGVLFNAIKGKLL